MRLRRAGRGFTLVELMVALFAMALLAVLSWRGLDGMTRAQAQTASRSDEVLTLQVGLAQWSADLDALIELPGTTALNWNGRVLRLTRRGSNSVADGVVVVAWTRRIENGNGVWLRWQSAQATTRGDLAQAWQQADIWSQNPGDELRRREVSIVPLRDWDIFFFRADAWTNPQSSDAATAQAAVPFAAGSAPANPLAAAAAAAAQGRLPDGVRLVLQLPQGQSISGQIVRDWVRPTLGGNKS
jgi:general secretion pathway protein J